MDARVAQQVQQGTRDHLSCEMTHSTPYLLGSDAAEHSVAGVASNAVAMPSYYPLLLIK